MARDDRHAWGCGLRILCALIAVVSCFCAPWSAAAVPGTSVVPERISSAQVQAILAAADEESHQAFADLLQQATGLSNALLAMKHGADQYPNFARHPLIQEISAAQKRYGKNLLPTKVEDIEDLKQLFQNVARIFGKFAPPGSYSLPEAVDHAIAAEQQRQQQIADAKSSIVQIENALDATQLVRANEIYSHLASAAAVPHFAQLYLQQTQGLGLDLASYAEAVPLCHHHEASLLQQVQNLGREVAMLNASQSQIITKAYLQDAIQDDSAAVRRRIAELPAFRFDETAHRAPATLSDTDRLAFITRQINNIDDSLLANAEARAVEAQPEAMKIVQGAIGGNEEATLLPTATQIAAAERVRASLVQEQATVQARIIAANEEQQRKIAAAQQVEQARAAAAEQAKERREAARREATEAPRRALASAITQLYVKRLRDNGADPYRTSFEADSETLGNIVGLIIHTNAMALPANAQEFIENSSSWVNRAYAVGFRAIRLTNAETTCDFEIVNPETVRPGVCFSQWMSGGYMRQAVVRQWPKGYLLTVK